MLLGHVMPLPEWLASGIVIASRALLVVALFLVGAGLSVAQIKAVGWKPMVLGLSLWLAVSVFSLLAIMQL